MWKMRPLERSVNTVHTMRNFTTHESVSHFHTFATMLPLHRMLGKFAKRKAKVQHRHCLFRHFIESRALYLNENK